MVSLLKKASYSLLVLSLVGLLIGIAMGDVRIIVTLAFTAGINIFGIVILDSAISDGLE